MTGNERRQSERFAPSDRVVVVDAVTNRPIGTIATLSSEGAMLLTARPVKPAAILRCRIDLKQPLLESAVIHFEAECRWCRKNVPLNRWESGYRLTANTDDAYRLSLLVLGFKLGQWGQTDLPDVTTIDLDNRRKAARFEFDSPLPVYEFKCYRQLGELADLSVSGCRLITDLPFRQDETLRCRVGLPKTVHGQDYLVLSLRCRWCRTAADNTRFESGHAVEILSRRDAALVLYLLINYGRPQPEMKRIGHI